MMKRWIFLLLIVPAILSAQTFQSEHGGPKIDSLLYFVKDSLGIHRVGSILYLKSPVTSLRMPDAGHIIVIDSIYFRAFGYPKMITQDNAGDYAFTGANLRTAVYVPGATSNSRWLVQARSPDGTTLPVAGDNGIPFSKTDSLVIIRPAGGTSGSTGSYVRIVK